MDDLQAAEQLVADKRKALGLNPDGTRPSEIRSQQQTVLGVIGNQPDRVPWTCDKCGEHYVGFSMPHPLKTGEMFVLPPPVKGDCTVCNEREREAFLAERERNERKEITRQFLHWSHIGSDFREFSFDKFELRPGSEAAVAKAKQFVDTFEEPDGPWLLLFGTPGNGKTSLGMAIRNEVERRYGCMALAITQPYLLLEIRKSWDRRGGESSDQRTEGWILDKLQMAKFVLIDDVKRWDPWAEDRMFVLLDGRIREKKKMVFTSNHTPEQLEDMLGARVWSRFAGRTEMVRNSASDYRITVQRPKLIGGR